MLTLAKIEDIRIFRVGMSDFEAGYENETSVINKESPDKRVLVSSAQSSIYRKVTTKINTEDLDGDGVAEATIGSLKELSMSSLGDKRVFSFVDFEVSNSNNGTYNYGVEFIITDPTRKFLNMRLSALRRARKQILSYYEEARSPGNFDSVTGQFSQAYLQQLKVRNNLDPSFQSKKSRRLSLPWRSSVRLYVTALQDLLGTKISKRDAMSLQKLLYPSSGDLSGVENFISLLNSLINDISKHEIVMSELKSRTSGGKNMSSISDRLEEKKVFLNDRWNATEHKNKKLYLNYLKGALQLDQTGLPKVNRSTLVNRFNVEAGKYFPEVVGKKESQVSNPDLSGFRRVYQSFLTPTTLQKYDGSEIVVNINNKESIEEAAILIEDRTNLSSGQTDGVASILKSFGAVVNKRRVRNRDGYRRSQAGAKAYLGDNTRFDIKTTDKDSSQGELVDDAKSSDQKMLEDLLVSSDAKDHEQDEVVSNKDGLPQRYLKLLRRRAKQRQENAEETTQETVRTEQKEEKILSNTTARARYVTGFGQDMEPIYSQKIPSSAKDTILIIESQESPGTATNNSVVVVTSSGNTVPEERLNPNDPCDDVIFIEQEKPERNEEPRSEPCPEGYKYDEQSDSCIEVKIVTTSNDPEDDPSSDVEGAGQSVVSSLPEVVEQDGEVATTRVATRDLPSTSQQETAFVRRPAVQETRSTNDTDAGARTTLTTTTTTGGGGGSYGY